jgi:hypothetical protein
MALLNGGKWIGGPNEKERPNVAFRAFIPWSDHHTTQDCDCCKQEFAPGQIAVEVTTTKGGWYEHEDVYADWTICPACVEDMQRAAREYKKE